MLKKTKIRLIFLLCICFQISWSQTVEIQGEVESSGDVENIHVINKTSQKFTITNAIGEFIIPVKLNDTIVVSAIQYKLETLVVTMAHVLSKKIKVTLEEHINELDEVVVGKMLTGDLTKDLNSVEGKPVTSLSLGIPSYQGPLMTQNERLLNEATTGGGFIPLSPILNAISGRTKRLKNRIKLDALEELLYSVKTRFSKDLFEESPLQHDKIMEYFYFVSDDENFTEICNYKSDLEILVFLKEKLKKYKTIINNEED